jgi:PTS system nitrogen regulatory IIA component
VDFASMDGLPSRIFVMTLSPVTSTGPHIEYLAAIGRRLDSPATRERLLAAATAEDVYRILTE